jgi:hypothetical protein
MLRSLKGLFGYTIQASDGEIGKVHDFYFDDEVWIIRYLVVDTAKLLAGRKVLLIPSALGEPDWSTRTFPVKLSKEQIIKSPDYDLNKPVSRQHEFDLHKHFRWAPYWIPFTIPRGTGVIPPEIPEAANKKEDADTKSDAKTQGDSHLRSAREIFGYSIQAIDGEIGMVKDLINEDIVNKIRYAVVDTGKWLPGKPVLISPLWIEKISWDEKKVYIDLLKEAIKNSPEFKASESINRRYEERLYDYYGRPKYWI